MVDSQSCIHTTYGYLFIGIIIFIIGIFLWSNLNLPYLTNIWAYLLILVLTLGLLWWMLTLSPGISKTILAIVLILILSYFLYPVIVNLTREELWKFVALTFLFFGLLTAIAFTAPPNYFASWGRILTILLFILIIVGIVGLFLFRNRTVTLIYFLLVLALFGAFVLYDTQFIIQVCNELSTIQRNPDYINMAASLFINALNIFTATAGIGTI